uniref:Uncharacterized protein n=1 Tax=Steinernema glaseri TaxID=37863 RepID=A0A1I8A7W9_9BILA
MLLLLVLIYEVSGSSANVTPQGRDAWLNGQFVGFPVESNETTLDIFMNDANCGSTGICYGGDSESFNAPTTCNSFYPVAPPANVTIHFEQGIYLRQHNSTVTKPFMPLVSDELTGRYYKILAVSLSPPKNQSNCWPSMQLEDRAKVMTDRVRSILDSGFRFSATNMVYPLPTTTTTTTSTSSSTTTSTSTTTTSTTNAVGDPGDGTSTAYPGEGTSTAYPDDGTSTTPVTVKSVGNGTTFDEEFSYELKGVSVWITIAALAVFALSCICTSCCFCAKLKKRCCRKEAPLPSEKVAPPSEPLPSEPRPSQPSEPRVSTRPSEPSSSSAVIDIEHV